MFVDDENISKQLETFENIEDNFINVNLVENHSSNIISIPYDKDLGILLLLY